MILIRVFVVDVPMASRAHRPAHVGGRQTVIRWYYLASAPPTANNHCAHYGPHYHHYCYCYDYLTNFHDYRLPFNESYRAVIAALVSATLLVPMMLATNLLRRHTQCLALCDYLLTKTDPMWPLPTTNLLPYPASGLAKSCRPPGI